MSQFRNILIKQKQAKPDLYMLYYLTGDDTTGEPRRWDFDDLYDMFDQIGYFTTSGTSGIARSSFIGTMKVVCDKSYAIQLTYGNNMVHMFRFIYIDTKIDLSECHWLKSREDNPDITHYMQYSFGYMFSGNGTNAYSNTIIFPTDHTVLASSLTYTFIYQNLKVLNVSYFYNFFEKGVSLTYEDTIFYLNDYVPDTVADIIYARSSGYNKNLKYIYVLDHLVDSYKAKYSGLYDDYYTDLFLPISSYTGDYLSTYYTGVYDHLFT